MSQCQVMDKKLMNVKLLDGKITKYVSFREVDLQTKLRALHTNNIHNIDAKYEVLEGVWVLDAIYFDNENQLLQEYLLKVEVERNKLFTTVE